ncbi:sialate O-acetylesterase [Bifidobacterium gallicum]|nr:sialate O-acetylesterase [Bifidobacterium gallicum]KFI59608.1 sugar binding domain protein, glycosyl hydrolase family 2 [Bifidobacterium gallicum DSM 20093 = LMG 11596]
MLRLPVLFGDGCVLQRDVPIKIWGWGTPGAQIEVTLGPMCQTVIVEEEGTWEAWFEPLRANECVSLIAQSFVSTVGALGDDDISAVQASKRRRRGPVNYSVEEERRFREAVAKMDLLPNAKLAMHRAGLCMTETLQRTCYVGEVFVCSGQSNMELPVSWTWRDDPALLQWEDPLLRQCKIMPDHCFEGPLGEPRSVVWEPYEGQHRRRFTTVGAWFGRALRRLLGVPVGLLNISLGGSPVESWMDKATASSFPHLAESIAQFRFTDKAEQLAQDSIVEQERWRQHCVQQRLEDQDLKWHDVVLPGDLASQLPALDGYHGELTLKRIVRLPERISLADYETLPALLDLGTMTDADETYVNGVKVGESFDRYTPRSYEVPAGTLRAGDNVIEVRLRIEGDDARVAIGKRLELRIGDGLVDVDDIEEFWESKEPKRLARRLSLVGVPHVVPDRRRQAAKQAAREEHAALWDLCNDIVEVDGRPLDGLEEPTKNRIIQHDFSQSLQVVNLNGAWQCAMSSAMPDACPQQVFINWKPMALFNAMLAPCFDYAVRAVLWYQGESNTGPDSKWYQAMLEAMIKLWRANWNVDRLPFFIVQLPELLTECADDGGWPTVREAQWRIMDAYTGQPLYSLDACDEYGNEGGAGDDVPQEPQDVSGAVSDVATIVALGCGDPYDLHPVHKREIAERLAHAAMCFVFGSEDDKPTPVAVGIDWQQNDNGWVPIAVEADTLHQGYASRSPWTGVLFTEDGMAPLGFEWILRDGTSVPTQACINQGQLMVQLPDADREDLLELRYAWSRNPHDGLVMGSTITPMPPFRLRIED